jgi:hypothetical protein
MFAASKSAKAVGAGPAPTTDTYFPYVSILLNTTSTNGQTNNTFLDSSSNTYTITKNGTPGQGSFTPYLTDGYWSTYLNGTTDYLNVVSPGASLQFGTGDFTIEFWANTNTNNAGDFFVISATGSGGLFVGYRSSTSSWGWGQAGVGWDYSSSVTKTNNIWQHIALIRSSGSMKMFVNGTQLGTTQSNSTSYSLTTTSTVIGWQSSTFYFPGSLSNLRVIKGQSLLGTATSFTPPTSPVTATSVGWTGSGVASSISGTVGLITCQGNRFKDSTNSYAITVGSGTPTIQSWQPFSLASSYTTTSYGGGSYFYSGDYLTATSPSLGGSGAIWTIEFWVYSVGSGTAQTMISFNAGLGAGINIWKNTSNQLVVDDGGTGQAAWTATTIVNNAWNHVAIVRNGTTTTGYINGVVAGSHTFTPQTTNAVFVGRFNSAVTPQYFIGFLSNLRVVNSVTVYTGVFTPPTLAPLTTAGSTSAASYSSTTNVNTSFAGSNTSLLLNFANAGIYDAAAQYVMTTAGSAQSSTTTYQWSPTSMKFNGTTDYLVAASQIGSSLDLATGQGNWTIELWFYVASTANAILFQRAGTNGVAYGSYSANVSSGTLTWNVGNGSLGGATQNISGISLSTWYYFALVRNSSLITAYINGTAQTAQSAPTMTNTGSQFSTVGAAQDSSPRLYLNGYVQDFRITKNIARTITTPTAAFPTR